MCAIDPATAATAALVISAVGTTASVGLGVYSAQQAAAQAQAQLNMQAQQTVRQQQMQRQQMLQAQEQQRMNMMLSQRQQREQYNMQIQQANVNIANQYNQQRRQVEQERALIQARYAADRLNAQRSKENTEDQKRFNNEAANKIYQQEQTKISEAKKKAAFASQAALAKSIGAKGSILAAGRTGQSVGLLLNDVERQAGFAQAQADAQLASTMEQSQISMDQGYLQALGANQRAENNRVMEPSNPYMPTLPEVPNFVNPYEQTAFGTA
jgi:hypothetical protein|tara:strand:- start:1151 stop:1957 length:807 start_codon:yes stop_codon:yes gene_type:complete